jgi:osmotically-inducible protein OsmY
MLMRTIYHSIAALALVWATGCGNTVEGVKKDAEINGQKAAEQTQDLTKSAAEAGKDISAAAVLTPAIKLAITADKRLNDPKNLIDVNSTDEKVTLSGHVTSEELKSLAQELAANVLKEKAAKQTLENKLEIKP